MSTKEIVDVFLRLIEILTAWPVILFLALILFRHPISTILPGLIRRVTKAEIGENKFEFSTIAVTAFQDAIELGAEEYKERPEKFVGFVREQVKKLPETQLKLSVTTKILGGRTILWVDDEPLGNTYETHLLKYLGATVVSARSVDEAVGLVKQGGIDLIIWSDSLKDNGHNNLQLGYKLLDKLSQKIKTMPLIFYSANITQMDREKASRVYGAASVPNELLKLVLGALQAQ